MSGKSRNGIRVLESSPAPGADGRPVHRQAVQLRNIGPRSPAVAEPAPPTRTSVWERTFPARRLIVDIIALTIIVGLAWLTWPTSLGGDTAYVIVKGTSMEPKFHTGDLAIVRTQDHYGVGDIVAYHIPKGNPGAGHLVIHRIIGHSHGGFLMKGINRTTPDAFYPKPSDVLGRYHFLIGLPGLGFWALLPWICAALVGVGVVWIAWPRFEDPDDAPADAPADREGRTDGGSDGDADAFLIPPTPVVVGQRRLRRMEAEAQRAAQRGGRRRQHRASVPVA